MKKFFNCLGISLMCMSLVGCGCSKKESTGGADIDLDNENLISCTNLSRHVIHEYDDLYESWKYVVEYDENMTDIKNWREIYTADYSEYQNELDIDSEKEKIIKSFCEPRVNDVTLGKYEENKDLCKITVDGKVITAVVTYPKDAIEAAMKTGYTQEKLTTELESGEYDGGFRGIYTCDKTYDSKKLEKYSMSGKNITVKYESEGNRNPESAENSLKYSVKTAIDSYRTNILKKYKVYLYDSVELKKISEGNGNYTYEINLTCEANSKEVCINLYDELYDYALNKKYFGIIVVK